MILGIVLPFLIYPLLSMILISSGQAYAWRFIISRFLIWAVLGLVFLYARQAEVQKFLLWDEKPYPTSFYFKSVGALYLMIIVSGIIAKIPYWMGLHENKDVIYRMVTVMKEYPILTVFTSFTAAVTEEFIFRGYMISRLSLFFRSKYPPIIISAVLFSIVHLGYKNVGEIIFTLMFGIITGYYYQQYRNIKVLMIFHFVVDMIATLSLMHHKQPEIHDGLKSVGMLFSYQL